MTPASAPVHAHPTKHVARRSGCPWAELIGNIRNCPWCSDAPVNPANKRSVTLLLVALLATLASGCSALWPYERACREPTPAGEVHCWPPGGECRCGLIPPRTQSARHMGRER
jgi:hypothetical protein